MPGVGPPDGRVRDDRLGRRFFDFGVAQAVPGDGVVVEVEARFRQVFHPVIVTVQSVQGFLHQRRQGFGTGASCLETFETQLFRQRQDAVVGRQDEEGLFPTHAFVQEGEEVGQLPVRAQGGVHGFLAEGSEVVADIVIGRKADDQDVRDIVLPELFLDDRLPGECQLVIRGPGSMLESVPVTRTGCFQPTFRHVREGDPAVPVVLLALADVRSRPVEVELLGHQALPFAAEGLVRQLLVVEALDPAGQVVHEVAARRDPAQGRLEPVRRAQFPGGDHSAVVLQGNGYGLAPVTGGHAQFVGQRGSLELPGGGATVLGGFLAEDVALRVHEGRLKHAPGPVVPPVVDHPGLVGVGAGGDHAVAWRGGSVDVAEPGVLHPRAMVHEPAEAVLHVEVFEPLQKVVAELVDDNQHREPRRSRRLGRGCLLRL